MSESCSVFEKDDAILLNVSFLFLLSFDWKYSVYYVLD